MNGASVFALAITSGLMAAVLGFAVGRWSAPTLSSPTLPEPNIREFVKEVPVIREVVKEVPRAPEQSVIDAAVEARLADMRGGAKMQFWTDVKARFDRLRRRADVEAVRANHGAASDYQSLSRLLTYKDTINLQDVMGHLYLLLRQPQMEPPVERIVKEALEYVTTAYEEAEKRGY